MINILDDENSVKSNIKFEELERGDKVLFARVLPNIGYYEIIELKMITVDKDKQYCSGAAQDKTKHMYLFNSKKHAETVLFKNRKLALEYLKEMKEKYKDVKVYKE